MGILCLVRNGVLIEDKWNKIVSDIEIQFLSVSKHVKTFMIPHSSICDTVILKHRLIPAIERCQEDAHDSGTHDKLCTDVDCQTDKIFSKFYENHKE